MKPGAVHAPRKRPSRTEVLTYRGVCAAMESTWAAIKKEIRHIWGPWEEMTRSQLRTVLFEYIETFYNRSRHQARLGHRTPAETYAADQAA